MYRNYIVAYPDRTVLISVETSTAAIAAAGMVKFHGKYRVFFNKELLTQVENLQIQEKNIIAQWTSDTLCN